MQQQDPNIIDENPQDQSQQQSQENTKLSTKTNSHEDIIFSDLELQNQQYSIEQIEEKSLFSQQKFSLTNTVSFNSLLPNDSLLSLLLRPNVTIVEILTHSDFINTFEQNNNSLIEKICTHMKEIIEFLKVEEYQKDEKTSIGKINIENGINNFLLAHHASEIISSDCKELSYMFFPPKDANSRKKHKDIAHNIQMQKDSLTMGIASAYESDAHFTSPLTSPSFNDRIIANHCNTYLEDNTVEPNSSKKSSINSSLLKNQLHTLHNRNSIVFKNNLQLGCEEQHQNEMDFLQYFLNLIFDFKASSHSISISYFYQVFLNFFNRDMTEMEYYIYEKIPSFCDRLIQLIDDATIMDLILLLINQPKTSCNTQVESQSAVPTDLQQEQEQEEEEFRNQFYFQKKKEIIEGLFDNLSFYKQDEETTKRLSCQSNNADALTVSSSLNLEERQMQKSKSIQQEYTYDQDILFWRMKNSSMIICEILDHFSDIRRGEDLGFVILNYHTQKIFQSLSSNNIDEISFNCDVAQHLLAFLQNEDIQFRIEFETIKGNEIVEKYFKESIVSIKKELQLAQTKKIDSFNGQFGERIAMFQAHRLKLIKLLELSFSFKIKEVVQEIFDQDILQIIIILFFQYEWNNQLHMNVMHLFETIIEVAMQNDNPSWIFYIIKRVKLVNYLVSNSENQGRRVINPITRKVHPIQKSYIGHLKRIAEALIKCIEQNSHYQVWIEDQNKWNELVEMVQKQQKLLKGKLGEEEEAPKQKFQLTCNAKNNLLNRRKKLMEGKKENSGENNCLSVNNPEVFQRLNSPIKKTITLQVGTPKQKSRGTTDEEDEVRESVSSLQSKKELQQQAYQKLSMDSPMLKNKNSTPQLSSNSSLASSSSLGMRTPKTPLLSTPTRTSQKAPTTPNMKKLLLSSPIQKADSQLKNKDRMKSIDSIEQNQSTKGSRGRRRRKQRINGNRDDYLNSNNNSLESDDFDSLDSSFSSISSVDSKNSRSPSSGYPSQRQGWRIKPREIHNYLLKDLDSLIGYDESSQVLTQKHSIKIDSVGFSFLNKKEKKLFDWNQIAEDEEEEEKQRLRKEECLKRLIQEEDNNQNNNSVINFFNPDAAEAIQLKREQRNNTNSIKQSLQSAESGSNSLNASPNRYTMNQQMQYENHKNNSIEDFNSPKVFRDSPYTPGLDIRKNEKSLNINKKKNFNSDSPCIEVNKQYFRYLIRDTIRKYSYDHQIDPKIKQIQNESTSKIRSCPQNHTYKSQSQFNLEDHKQIDIHLRSLIPIKQLQKNRDGRFSYDFNQMKLSIPISSNQNLENNIKSMDSLKYQKHAKVNSKLIKQVRDNLDISDESSNMQKSRENLSDEKTPQRINSDILLKELSQSENSSEDEKVQQRVNFIGRKNVKKKSTFYQQMKETKTTEQKKEVSLQIEEEIHPSGSTNCVHEDSSNRSTPFNKRHMFSKQSSEEKILNQKLKVKLHNMNIEMNEKDSYGDLEDSSPYIRKSSRSKKSMGSDQQSSRNNKSNNLIQISEDKQFQADQISSQTSILAKLDNFMLEESEKQSQNSKEDQLFLNLISGEEESMQKSSNKQITIANTIIQRSQKIQKSYFGKLPNQQIVGSTGFKGIDESSNNSMFNSMNIQGKESSSSSSLLSFSHHHNTQETNGQNNKNKIIKCSSKNDNILDKIPQTQSNQLLPEFLNGEEDDGEQDLILKILQRLENNTSNSNLQNDNNFDEQPQLSNPNKDGITQEEQNSQSHQ